MTVTHFKKEPKGKMSSLTHLQWRAAIKQYNPDKKLTDQQLAHLIDAARMAPTSYGVQPFKIIVVSDQKTKQKLRAAGYDQPQFTDASHIFVFAARTDVTETDIDHYAQRITKQRDVSTDEISDFVAMMKGSVNGKSPEASHHWAARQAYVALGMTIAEASRVEIDTTPMEGFDADAFDTILNLEKDGYHAVVVMAAGFRSADDSYATLKKVRKSVTDFVDFV